MSETPVLMTVSDSFFFLVRNHFMEGGFTFQWGSSFLSVGCPMEEGISFDREGGFQKKSWDGWMGGEGVETLALKLLLMTIFPVG